MALWGSTKQEMRNEDTEEARKTMREVAKRLAKIEGRLDVSKEALKLTDNLVQLKQQVSDMEIEKAKREEAQARREREVTHKVGLEQKRQEVEIEQAMREAKLEVREENLAADRNRFEEQMKFTTQHMQREIERIEKIAGQLMERLPVVSVDRQIREAVGTEAANGNGEGGD